MKNRAGCALLIVACFNSLSIDAGEKEKKDTFLNDYAVTRGFMRGRPIKPKFTPDGKKVLFLRSDARAGKLSLFEFDVSTGKTRTLLTPEDVLAGGEEKLSPEEKAMRERMRVSAGGFAEFHMSPSGDAILVGLGGKLFLMRRSDKGIRTLKTGAGPLLDPKFSPDGRFISYMRDNDVFVFDLKADREQRVTNGGTEEVSHGLAEFVAQEEMSRFSGYWWGPDSQRIVYQESDARKVEKWHVADPFQPEQAGTPFYYPRPGKANVDVKLAITDLSGAKPIWIEWDRKEYPYLATVRWGKKGPLFISVQTRDQKKLAVLGVDVATGKTRQLLVEEDGAWVNIHQETPRWVDKEDGFLWVTERSGGPQLELRGGDGAVQRVLVPANQGYRSLVDVDLDHGLVYFTASRNQCEEQVHQVSLKTGAIQTLTPEKGLFAAVLAPGGDRIAITERLWDALTPAKFMPRTVVFETIGMKRLGELPSEAEEPPFTPETQLVEVGKEGFWAAVTVPRHREPEKTYPVLVDVYGGPHHIHVMAARNRWLLNQWYADHGFVVVALDGRGTPGRGRDWERAIFEKFGEVPITDQVAGLRELGKRFPIMDLSRVGIQGWSFGGYMSALAVLKRPDVFHAGVAGAPVSDWYDYDTHYTERYLGVPPAAEKAYEEASLLPLAKGLKQPLLLLHGTADDNVYFRHSLKLANAFLRSGRDFEMMPLPGFTHMVTEPAVWEQMQRRMLRFLERNLKDRS